MGHSRGTLAWRTLLLDLMSTRPPSLLQRTTEVEEPQRDLAGMTGFEDGTRGSGTKDQEIGKGEENPLLKRQKEGISQVSILFFQSIREYLGPCCPRYSVWRNLLWQQEKMHFTRSLGNGHLPYRRWKCQDGSGRLGRRGQGLRHGMFNVNIQLRPVSQEGGCRTLLARAVWLHQGRHLHQWRPL